ncbi:MAG TPA: ferredoxin [Longimicrobiales bacterium]|nr:ferredoxin [Longimicrobiales bacterium]
MTQLDRRHIGDLVIEIDRDLCVGFGDCIDEAGPAFELDADGVAVFSAGCDSVSREALVRACESCPVDALTALDDRGVKLAP